MHPCTHGTLCISITPPVSRRAVVQRASTGRSVVLLSRFARRLDALLNQKVRPESRQPWKTTEETGSGGVRTQLATAAAVTGLAATAATGAATLAVCVPVLGSLIARTAGGAAAGYLRRIMRRRGQLRDQATAGTFLLELPMATESCEGRFVLEGMLMPQSLNGSDSDHLALLHFPDQDAAESFLAREELQRLQQACVEDFEVIQLEPRNPWRARWEALRLRLRQKPSFPRSFSKDQATLLADQLARMSGYGGPLAAVHFVSIGSDDPSLARSAASAALNDVWRAGGRGQYFAYTVKEAVCIELFVSSWKKPGDLLKYLRLHSASEDFTDFGADSAAARS
ncbi:unnamed protein product [Effrenium voratum]|nr:unnamed protein product [Effrenium voratum]